MSGARIKSQWKINADASQRGCIACIILLPRALHHASHIDLEILPCIDNTGLKAKPLNIFVTQLQCNGNAAFNIDSYKEVANELYIQGDSIEKLMAN